MWFIGAFIFLSCWFFLAHEVLSAIFFTLPLPRLFFVVIVAVFFFFSTGVVQCDGCLFLSFCVGAHGWVALLCQSWGHYFNLGAGCHCGSTWILQAPNLHFRDAVVEARLAEWWKNSPSTSVALFFHPRGGSIWWPEGWVFFWLIVSSIESLNLVSFCVFHLTSDFSFHRSRETFLPCAKTRAVL